MKTVWLEFIWKEIEREREKRESKIECFWKCFALNRKLLIYTKYYIPNISYKSISVKFQVKSIDANTFWRIFTLRNISAEIIEIHTKIDYPVLRLRFIHIVRLSDEFKESGKKSSVFSRWMVVLCGFEVNIEISWTKYQILNTDWITFFFWIVNFQQTIFFGYITCKCTYKI